ncbi:MAG: Trm112 family protein [Candidatus Humimicrobiia bacterium]
MNVKLLKIVACPICKGSLKLKEDKLICYSCRKYFNIENDIPIMLIEEAKDIKEIKEEKK